MKPLLLVLAISLTACGGPVEEPVAADPFVAFGPSFVADGSVRRAALEASLVMPSNGYSQLRLQKYGGEWDSLPVRNFPVRPVVSADVGAFDVQPYRRTEGDFARVYDDLGWTEDELLALGREAFHNYPLELAPRFFAALESEAAADELGLWSHDGRVGGLVRVRLDDGSETVASTCSTCHASVMDDDLVDGRANSRIDNDAMSRRLTGGFGSDWGPGAADVTADGSNNPVAITDLRAIRHQTRLHWAATLHNSPEALAVRIETLMITSANEAMRPPREVAVALAYYLWSLGSDASSDETSAGAQVFSRECSSCHGTLDAVPLAMVGTDPAVGLSSTRGTGEYRVPNLVGVGSRSQFLHQGRIKSLELLFDAARLDEVPGHIYGTNLSVAERTALLDYLASL